MLTLQNDLLKIKKYLNMQEGVTSRFCKIKKSPEFYCFGNNFNLSSRSHFKKCSVQSYTYMSHSLHLFYTPKYFCRYHLPNSMLFTPFP